VSSAEGGPVRQRLVDVLTPRAAVEDRGGCNDWKPAAYMAGRFRQLSCLQWLLHMDPSLTKPLMWDAVNNLERLVFLHNAGCVLTADESLYAIWACRPDVLDYCLRHNEPRRHEWAGLMTSAIIEDSTECMRVLYQNGFEEHRPRNLSYDHPALKALYYKSLPCLRVALQHSGVPDDVSLLNTAAAAEQGEEMLRVVRELEAPFNHFTTRAAIHAGQPGALRYALADGAPWNADTIRAAIAADSLECLQCVHEHACMVGFPEGWPGPAGRGRRRQRPPKARSLPLLEYICEHMDPEWAQQVLMSTSAALALQVRNADVAEDVIDWKLLRYVERKLKRPCDRRFDGCWRRKGEGRRTCRRLLRGSEIGPAALLTGITGPVGRHGPHSCRAARADCLPSQASVFLAKLVPS
jgi:hypothetical protein